MTLFLNCNRSANQRGKSLEKVENCMERVISKTQNIKNISK